MKDFVWGWSSFWLRWSWLVGVHLTATVAPFKERLTWQLIRSKSFCLQQSWFDFSKWETAAQERLSVRMTSIVQWHVRVEAAFVGAFVSAGTWRVWWGKQFERQVWIKWAFGSFEVAPSQTNHSHKNKALAWPIVAKSCEFSWIYLNLLEFVGIYFRGFC